MYVIKSNRKTNSYTVRKINRITQVVRVGRRGLQGETGSQGPKGNQGDPATNLVQSVNGKQGVVVLNATDVVADPAGSAATALTNAKSYTDTKSSQALQDAKDYTDTEVSTLDSSFATVAKTGSYNDLSNKPTIPTIAGLATEAQVQDVQDNLDAHEADTANPHAVTKDQVGLSNVDNTSDANKPVSTAQQSALDGKSNTTHNHTLASLTEKSYNSLTDKPSLFDGAYSSLSGTPSTFTPSAHTHGVGDINATGTASSTTYLRGDGTWSTVSGGGVTDHSALTGLANDDHTQYLLANGTRTLSGTLTLTNSSLNGGDAHIRTVGNKGLQIQRGDTTPATFRLLPNGDDIYFQNTGTGGVYFSGLNATTMTSDVIFVTSGAIRANANLVATSGTPTRYWTNTFTQTLNLNASASLSGTTAGTMNMVATNIAINGTNGATGSFTSQDSKTVTVTKGIITSIT